ncbi:hypothetical protein Ocin01_08438 [Orchesella cincta]|uniref:Ig-like domain-containing protein n=1 Tax=Orchesella cincta TaxID=48709 RepID=A0A1D2MYX4_ORCCI|nr:hypothetical protein Ocin01_08438 [Orchesella cincta]
MSYLWISLSVVILAFHDFTRNGAAHAQGATPAKVDVPTVHSTVGNEAKLLCSLSEENNETSSSSTSASPLRYCVWERVDPASSSSQTTLILNFNDINSQPGIFSGVSGYSYQGEGFREGECGVKIATVKTEDIAKWQCTLITDEKVFRGYVMLEKEEPPKKNETVGSAVAARTAIDDGNQFQTQSSFRPRPIITSYEDARAIIQPEIIVQSTSSDGSPLIQEVKVESAGLQIKPRRGGKLIVFE